MTALKLKYDHNQVAFLGKKKCQISLYVPMLEFLKKSKIHYELTHSPDVTYQNSQQSSPNIEFDWLSSRILVAYRTLSATED
ncbi:MAG: hypothetical protein J6W71_05480 [Methanobrevibacter sp.]|nr:hypothetical protein [Methanobrevibacter sp.]